MKKQKQQGIKKRLTKGFVKAAVIGAIAAMIGVVALLIAASQYEKALNRYGFTQGDIGKAMTAFSESRSALRAVVGYDEEAVIKKQTELHTEKKEAFNTYMEELDRTLRFDEGRTAYDEVLRALDGYWELDEQVLQLAVSDDADGYLKAQELDTGDLTTQYENVYAQFVNLMNVCVEKGDRAEKNLRHMEFIMLIVILVIVISSFWSSIILGKKMAGDIEKPMVALADRLQSFAQGDLVSEFPECNTEDEIAYMIRVAKEMADNLNDRCLLEQDIGKATVLSGSKWTLTKEQLNDYMQKKALHFDEEKYIAWENEDPLWNLEKNDVILEKAGRLRYPFAGMGTQEKYWSAKASFQADRISPVFWLRRSRNVQNKRDNTEENN